MGESPHYSWRTRATRHRLILIRICDNDPAVIDEMLRKAKNIAVVGMSDKPRRASYNIGRYLAAHGYRVFPVNPALEEILGMRCYAGLDAAQAAAQAETAARESIWSMCFAHQRTCRRSSTT